MEEHENKIKRRFSRIDLFFEEGVCRWHMTDEKKRDRPERILKMMQLILAHLQISVSDMIK